MARGAPTENQKCGLLAMRVTLNVLPVFFRRVGSCLRRPWAMPIPAYEAPRMTMLCVDILTVDEGVGMEGSVRWWKRV